MEGDQGRLIIGQRTLSESRELRLGGRVVQGTLGAERAGSQVTR